MSPRYTRTFAALVVAGAIAVPAAAQANGGRDDPPNHEQPAHQIENHSGRDRVDNDRRDRHDRVDNDRRDRHDHDHRDGRGGDDGPNHR